MRHSTKKWRVADRTAEILEAHAALIRGLLEIREWLGLQLNHAWGNIDDTTLEVAGASYLATRDQHLDERRAKIVAVLMKSQLGLDAETLSEALGVRLDEVVRLMQRRD